MASYIGGYKQDFIDLLKQGVSKESALEMIAGKVERQEAVANAPTSLLGEGKSKARVSFENIYNATDLGEKAKMLGSGISSTISSPISTVFNAAGKSISGVINKRLDKLNKDPSSLGKSVLGQYEKNIYDTVMTQGPKVMSGIQSSVSPLAQSIEKQTSKYEPTTRAMVEGATELVGLGAYTKGAKAITEPIKSLAKYGTQKAVQQAPSLAKPLSKLGSAITKASEGNMKPALYGAAAGVGTSLAADSEGDIIAPTIAGATIGAGLPFVGKLGLQTDFGKSFAKKLALSDLTGGVNKIRQQLSVLYPDATDDDVALWIHNKGLDIHNTQPKNFQRVIDNLKQEKKSVIGSAGNTMVMSPRNDVRVEELQGFIRQIQESTKKMSYDMAEGGMKVEKQFGKYDLSDKADAIPTSSDWTLQDADNALDLLRDVANTKWKEGAQIDEGVSNMIAKAGETIDDYAGGFDLVRKQMPELGIKGQAPTRTLREINKDMQIAITGKSALEKHLTSTWVNMIRTASKPLLGNLGLTASFVYFALNSENENLRNSIITQLGLTAGFYIANKGRSGLLSLSEKLSPSEMKMFTRQIGESTKGMIENNIGMHYGNLYADIMRNTPGIDEAIDRAEAFKATAKKLLNLDEGDDLIALPDGGFIISTQAEREGLEQAQKKVAEYAESLQKQAEEKQLAKKRLMSVFEIQESDIIEFEGGYMIKPASKLEQATRPDKDIVPNDIFGGLNAWENKTKKGAKEKQPLLQYKTQNTAPTEALQTKTTQDIVSIPKTSQKANGEVKKRILAHKNKQ